MAAIPKLKGFLIEDFKEAPAWFQKFIEPLNQYMTSVTNGLSGRLTTQDNFLAYDEPLDFTTNATAANTFPLRFKNKLLGGVKPVSVTVGQLAKNTGASLSAAWSMSWILNPAGEIEISFQGLENSTRYVGNLRVSA